MNTLEYIKNEYGEKAIPHRRETPFEQNNLMVRFVSNDLSVRAFSPSEKNGYFVVEYYEKPSTYRLDVDLLAETVSVKKIEGFVEVAKYSFAHRPNVFSVSFVSGENRFFNEVRNAIKTYYDVAEGFIWIGK